MTNAEVYQRVTDRIVAQLDQGTVPWHKPWDPFVGEPRSIDNRPYRGINVFLLALEDRSDPRWGTYNAIKRHGGQVRKGEHGTAVILWKPTRIKDRDADEPGATKPFLLAREYRVFNVTQADWATPLPELTAATELEPVDAAEAQVAGYPNPPTISVGFTHAAYAPSADRVEMPARHAFESIEAYYTTLFHELTHSTGAAHRLDRFDLHGVSSTFGSPPYAREELTAEIGGAILTATAGLEPRVEASAAYLKNWMRALESDPKLITQAASRAFKAADLILNTPT